MLVYRRLEAFGLGYSWDTRKIFFTFKIPNLVGLFLNKCVVC